MPSFTPILTAVSLVLLAHAIYSAHEHSVLVASRSASSASPRTDSTRGGAYTSPSAGTAGNPNAPPTSASLSLPTDIIVEALVATIALTVAIVASAPPLRHIRWAEWGGRIERGGWVPGFDGDKDRDASAVKTEGGAGVGNPYRVLEERRGFWDVRAARRAFADIIRDGQGG